MHYDLLIKDGTLVDPAQGIHAQRDVAFKDAKVAAVAPDIPRSDAEVVVEADDYLVTPGLIDVHVHVFAGVSHYGIEPDPTCLARGATTVVDAGSAGADTFPGFRKYVIDVSATRILAQLNISSLGMLTREIGELMNPDYANVEKACAMIEANRDVILGVKVRLTKNTIVGREAGMTPLYRAREAADAAGLPIMVHPQDAWCESIDDILRVMKFGDILTHSFHAQRCGILDTAGKVRSSVHEAIERGVLFDVGHGSGSFSWDVAEQAMAQGVEPQTISSDLHAYNVEGPVYDLANVVSKFLALGMTLDDAIAKVTSVPAKAVLAEDQIGTLCPGAWGDAVVFALRPGEFPLVDSCDQTRLGNELMEPIAVVKAGKVYRDYR